MPRTVVVEWVGEIDLRTVAAERDKIDRLIDSGVADPLCLDLGQVDFVDSSALGLLVHIREACEDAQVELRLLNVSTRTRQLFAVTGLAGLFAVDGGEPAGPVDPAVLPSRAPLPAAPDPVFDDLAALTARLLDVPVATVTLVDRDGQVYPGATGLRAAYQELRSTPLSHSLCQHVVAGAAELVVPDLRADPSFADHPARQDLDVIAYAGTPVVGADGRVAGSLCAMSSAPVDWTADQLKNLRLVARIASAELDARDHAEQGRQAIESYRTSQGVAVANLLAGSLLLTHALGSSSGTVANDITQALEHADRALSALGPAGTVTS